MNIKTILVMLLLFLPAYVSAHKSSDSYLSLDTSNNEISAQWDIALRDLEFAIGLDNNSDGKLNWSEIKNKHEHINRYALSHLDISSNNTTCSKTVSNNLLDKHTDGTYTVIRFSIKCDDTDHIAINYTLLFDLDSQHRGLIKIKSDLETQSFVMSPDNHNIKIFSGKTNRWLQFTSFVKEGAYHIFAGLDHILFLLSLLLPAVLLRKNNYWLPIDDFKTGLLDVGKIVTAFTVSHSITLSLSIFNIIYLPSRLVESMIALSVIIIAINNIYPFINARRWQITMLFGLIHGFGFASVLQDLNITGSNLLISLLGFNAGIELGQLMIVGLFLPLAYLIRRHWLYYRLILQLGSFMIIAISLVWLVERSLALSLPGL